MTTWSQVLLSLAFCAAGCTVREASRETTTARLTFSGVTNAEDGSRRILLTISNTLAHPIYFHEILPDRMTCTIEIQNGGTWSNVNPYGYCATGWNATELRPGQAYTMQMQYIPMPVPWRVGYAYWIETERKTYRLRTVTVGWDRDEYQIWTPEIPPLERKNKPNEASHTSLRADPER